MRCYAPHRTTWCEHQLVLVRGSLLARLFWILSRYSCSAFSFAFITPWIILGSADPCWIVAWNLVNDSIEWSKSYFTYGTYDMICYVYHTIWFIWYAMYSLYIVWFLKIQKNSIISILLPKMVPESIRVFYQFGPVKFQMKLVLYFSIKINQKIISSQFPLSR